MDLKLWQERYGEHMQLRHWSPETVATYRQALKPFFGFLDSQGIGSLSAVTRDTLEDYRSHVFHLRSANGKPWSPSTQRIRLGAVRGFFRFLQQTGYLLVDLGTGLDLPKVARKLPVVLSESEVVQLLQVPDVNTLQGLRDRAVLEVLYGGGLRNSELCALELDQVELAGELPLLRILRGKGNKARVVPLGQEALGWLETYLVQVRPRWLFRSAESRVFLGSTGRPLTRAVLGELVSRLARRAKLGKPVTPHTLRHSCATHMLRRGAGLRQLQALLGHASSATTEHYTKVEVSDLAKVLRRHHPRERR